jgi:glycosyltransferase involved in cell wall biosynthesis
MIDVSVIIPAYNASSTIDRLITGLLNQNYNLNKFEVIIINDGSTDDTLVKIKQNIIENPNLILRLYSCQNGGQGIARNIGIKHAKGRIIAFTDADCIPTKNWIKNIVTEIIDNKRSFVSGLTTCSQPIVNPWRVSPAGQRNITANLAALSKIVKKVRFDSKFRHCEDTDFVLRLADQLDDTKIYYSNIVQVEHPINILRARKVIRYARRRFYENLLIKVYGRRVYSSMHPIYRPYIFGIFSPFFATFFAALLVIVILGWNGLILDVGILLVGSLIFVFWGYKLVIRNINENNNSDLSYIDRSKTLFYFIIYNFVYLYSRIEGSVKFRKVVI